MISLVNLVVGFFHYKFFSERSSGSKLKINELLLTALGNG